MEIKVEEEQQPLLRRSSSSEIERRTMIQKVIGKTFQSTADLAKRLPTGVVLAFQLLLPIFSNNGDCDSASRMMTTALLAICGFSCFLLSFTDSFRDKNGNVCYGFATIRGLWIVDGSCTLPPELSEKYRLRFIDFAHAILSLLVFATVALFNGNVVSCFYPEPSIAVQEVLTVLPVGMGVFCSMLFVAFPTKRHGYSLPLSAN